MLKVRVPGVILETSEFDFFDFEATTFLLSDCFFSLGFVFVNFPLLEIFPSCFLS